MFSFVFGDENVEQSRLVTGWNVRQHAVPHLEQRPQFPTQLLHFCDAFLEMVELDCGERANLRTRNAAAIAYTKNARQLANGKTDIQRGADQPHPFDDFRGKHAIAAGRPLSLLDEAVTLIVTHCVPTDSCPSGYLSDV